MASSQMPSRRKTASRKSTQPFGLVIATSWLPPESARLRQDEAVREACGEGPDWTEYVQLVERHRTSVVNWAVLKRVSGIAIPEAIREILRRLSDACRVMAIIHLQVLATVLKSFNAAGIPAMPWKGPFLSLKIYGDAGLRQSKDLDIFVPREYMFEARKSLLQAGWQLEKDDSYLTSRKAELRSTHEQHVSFVHGKHNCELELHWRTFSDIRDTAALRWESSIQSEWHGCSYQAMNAVDLTIALCEHGGGHTWFRAKWLGDMARIYADQQMEAEVVLEQARTLGKEKPFLLCLRLLQDAYGFPMPESIGRELRSIDSFVLERTLQKLTEPAEICTASWLKGIRETVLHSIYVRGLWPRKSNREIVAKMIYSAPDFELIQLPDRLFWLYFPLRPFLWVWRSRKRPFV